MTAWRSKAVKREIFTELHHATIHYVRKSFESSQMEVAAITPLVLTPFTPSTLSSTLLSTLPGPWLIGSRAAADSECREKEAGRAAGYEDVHGDADVNVAAAGSDGGGSGEGWRWRWCQCGRAGWLMLERGASYVTLCWHWRSGGLSTSISS